MQTIKCGKHLPIDTDSFRLTDTMGSSHGLQIILSCETTRTRKCVSVDLLQSHTQEYVPHLGGKLTIPAITFNEKK